MSDDLASIRAVLATVLPIGIPSPLPPALGPEHERNPKVPHAPTRAPNLTKADRRTALANALRYFKQEDHAALAPEFARELDTFGHIYMYRLKPTEYEMRAYPLAAYPAKSQHAAAILAMLMNNLDHRIAMYPEELITYGGNGGVFNNWAQFRLTVAYLCRMTDTQTLSLYSGHPAGLFPSHADAPRVVVTNGMMIPNYSTHAQYERLYAMGVTQYGQMTAGSFCYIGPQGIVHGTTITFTNAGRKYLQTEGLEGRVIVTSGLGGMSGAQAKAGVICRAVTVIAEVDPAALDKRHAQGWLMEKHTSLDTLVDRIRAARRAKEAVSLGFLGNIVSLWERLADEADRPDGDGLLVDLGSDQTSLHNPFHGGYFPVQLSFEEGRAMLAADQPAFKALVQESLRRHVSAINRLCAKGMRFWDYGNSFLLEAGNAGAEVWDPSDRVRALNRFRYPSYVQDIMGDIFSLGFGPFRWVCMSQAPEDLAKTDAIAEQVLTELEGRKETSPASAGQFRDNILWIQQAGANRLVVGSQARILYADCVGRATIAQRFNEAVANGHLSASVVLSRDHHDVSGTDAPFRETSDVSDGSELCADMSVQNVIGDAARGATWVSLHNGGGTGWGNVMNGGFGLVLDGSADSGRRAKQMLYWDVLNGVNRRSWSGNGNALDTIRRAMDANPELVVTLPVAAQSGLLEGL